MMTGSVIWGRGPVGAIVCTPSPGILNEIVSVKPVCAFALRMAWCSDPGPLLFVFVTTMVNGTSVGVEGNVSDGGVFTPVFDESDVTVTITWFVTTGHAGDSSGQNGW